MLEVSGLEVAYGAVTAVDGIDLAVAPGECVALLGANGAGKTSTLRAIMGSVPGRGAVRFDGRDVTGVPTEERARRGLIHVPEGRRIYPTLSVDEQLQLGRIAGRGRDRAFSHDDVFGWFPQLADLRQRQGWMLSGGEQQMLAIARAVLASPRMLLLDEPCLGLAPVLVTRLLNVVREIAATIPVLLVEQNTSAALSIADRGYVLSRGRIVHAGRAHDLAADPSLLATLLGLVGPPAGVGPET